MCHTISVTSKARLLEDLLNGMRLNVPKFCPDVIGQQMTRCWQVNPDERPSFAELKKHIYEEVKAIDDKRHTDYNNKLRYLKVVFEKEGTFFRQQFQQIQQSNSYPKVRYTTVDPIRTEALNEVRRERILEHQPS